MHEFFKEKFYICKCFYKKITNMGRTLLKNIQKGVKSALVKAAYHYAPDLCGKHYNHRFVQIDGTKCAYRDKVCG